MTAHTGGARIQFYTSSHMALQGHRLHTFGFTNDMVQNSFGCPPERGVTVLFLANMFFFFKV